MSFANPLLGIVSIEVENRPFSCKTGFCDFVRSEKKLLAEFLKSFSPEETELLDFEGFCVGVSA